MATATATKTAAEKIMPVTTDEEGVWRLIAACDGMRLNVSNLCSHQRAS